MAAAKNINLIHVRTSLPSQLAEIEAYGRKVSTASLLLFLTAGFLVGGTFVFLRLSAARLEETKETLERTIAQNTVKEGLLAAIKSRVGVVDKIAATRNSVGPLLDAVSEAAVSTQLSSISIVEERVVMAINVSTLEEVLGIADTLVRQSGDGTIKDPQILSMAISRDGAFEVTFAFTGRF